MREVALIDGPAGWGEFGGVLEYEPPGGAHWLAAGISGVRDSLVPGDGSQPINATVPAVPAAQVPEVPGFPGARTAM